MKRKWLNLWFCAALFGAIQLSADVIKSALKGDYFLMAIESIALVWIVILGIMVYRKTKLKTREQ